MPIKIAAYTESHVEQVLRFNARLRAGGMNSQFPPRAVSDWLPHVPGRRLFQDYYVAADETGVVRGAYILKHQDFQVAGRVISIGDFQLPISEGAVNPAFVNVATMLLFDCQHRQPLFYGLGIGGYDEPVARFGKAAGSTFSTVPFFFKVIHPVRFLRQITHLRRSAMRRLVLDAMAFTGAGYVGFKAAHTLLDRRAARRHGVTVERVDEFGPWADELWQACKDAYPMIAVRDLETLRILYPREKEKFIRLKVRQGDHLIGWAVLLNTQMTDHKHFGAMRLGAFVDSLAAPADAATVVSAATACLEPQGVDLIVSNQSHRQWRAAFNAAGYLRGPSTFLLATSRALTTLLTEQNIANDDIYMTRGDGDGPIHL
jgi:hypothetical protein